MQRSSLPVLLTELLSIKLKLKDNLFLGRKVMTSLGSVLKSRDITLPTKLYLVKLWFFQ